MQPGGFGAYRRLVEVCLRLGALGSAILGALHDLSPPQQAEGERSSGR